MPTQAHSDLSGLARLAQIPGSEIRPLLLRVQAASFAAAPHRDREAIDRFEALALGLIPLVTSDVLADVQNLLRSVLDAPRSVRALLSERLTLSGGSATWRDASPDGDVDACLEAERTGLSGAEIASLLVLDREEIDLALAGNDRIVIDGPAWHLLVERARGRPRLARRALARPEATASDRAALYGFAGEGERDRVRQDLAAGLDSAQRLGPILPVALRETILAHADAGNVAGLLRLVGDGLGSLEPLSLDLGQEGGRELLVLALLSLGLEPDGCIRVSLTLDDRIARSIPAVFRLAEVARTTSRAVACRILACAVPSGTPAERKRRRSGAERSSEPVTHKQRRDRVQRGAVRAAQGRPSATPGSGPPPSTSPGAKGRSATAADPA